MGLAPTPIQLKHIVSSANQGYVLSFLDALRALFQGPALVQKGYEKVCSPVQILNL